MAETEVESILREIRERVVSQQRAGQSARSLASNAGNGAEGSLEIAQRENGAAPNDETLALVNSQLAITARAWDRLPPLLSNRSGFTARLELWLKRIFKRSSHWYTWEQVNFNAAVHHALRDLLPVLSAHEQELQRLVAETEARRTQLEQAQAAQLTAIEAAATQLEANFTTLANELRERDQLRLEEQRVCFKQLALEASEAAVLEDRARRKTEALVEELQRRIEELKK